MRCGRRSGKSQSTEQSKDAGCRHSQQQDGASSCALRCRPAPQHGPSYKQSGEGPEQCNGRYSQQDRGSRREDATLHAACSRGKQGCSIAEWYSVRGERDYLCHRTFRQQQAAPHLAGVPALPTGCAAGWVAEGPACRSRRAAGCRLARRRRRLLAQLDAARRLLRRRRLGQPAGEQAQGGGKQQWKLSSTLRAGGQHTPQHAQQQQQQASGPPAGGQARLTEKQWQNLAPKN